jgi:hypothetical protein
VAEALTGGGGMNTLELYILYELFFLIAGVIAVHQWRRGYQPRFVLACWIMLCSILLYYSSTMILDLVSQPALIRPLSGWVAWAAYATIVLFLIGILVNLGRFLLRVTQRR